MCSAGRWCTWAPAVAALLERVLLELARRHEAACKSVFVLINGGPGALASLLRHLERRRPAVVVTVAASATAQRLCPWHGPGCSHQQPRRSPRSSRRTAARRSACSGLWSHSRWRLAAVWRAVEVLLPWMLNLLPLQRRASPEHSRAAVRLAGLGH